jgi:acyl-CoA reductase-like NAD-dependent aldehyde dehydrogenase
VIGTLPISPASAEFLQRVEAWRPEGLHSSDRLTVLDPSTGAVLVSVPRCDEADVDAAVRRAGAAFSGWRRARPGTRRDLLWSFAGLVAENTQTLAELESIDVGKPITVTSQLEVPGAAAYLRYFAGWADKIEGATIPTDIVDAHASTVRQPVGVCAQIVPWNFPLNMAVWKLAPALAAGCAVVLKPSELTPLSALFLAELAERAGYPEGVVNVVTGDGRTGAALANHRDVAKVAFTGSTAVGRQILQASADSNLKRVSLELGGKNPIIVFPDADLEQAAAAAVRGFTANAGQNCSASSRLLVHHEVHDELVDRVRTLAAQLRVGSALDPQTQMGPLISQAHRERVHQHVSSAARDGADVTPTHDLADGPGFLYSPTLILGTDNAMPASRQEIFGPVLSAITFETEDEAVSLANDSEYGLTASVWSRDPSRGPRLAGDLDAGIVQINCVGKTHPAAPFGGFKHSGLGREGGQEAIRLYTEVKTIWTGVEPN